DRQRLPTTASSSGTTFGTPGRVAVLDGTGWLTFDAKATWRPMGLADKGATHVVSFGLHVDHYTLRNPTFNTLDWRAGRPISSVATEGDGKTRTQATWLQDVWRIASAVKLTFGARYESWRGYDGFNANGATVVRQRDVGADRFSPKISGVWS